MMDPTNAALLGSCGVQGSRIVGRYAVTKGLINCQMKRRLVLADGP